MKTLITGAWGFIGTHLVERLREGGTPPDDLVTAGMKDSPSPDIRHFKTDLSDLTGVDGLIRQIQPDRVFHLAGMSKVRDDIGFPQYFYANYQTTAALLRALRRLQKPVTFFLASSVHVYGNQTEPVDETSEVHPISAYGYTKFLAEEELRGAAEENPRLRGIIGRLYSCIGPGQEPGFVASDLCRKILDLKTSRDNTLSTGPLTPYRRFLDVRDLVEVLVRLVERPLEQPVEVFNIASPHELQVRDILEKLLEIAQVRPRVQSQGDNPPNRFRGLQVSTDKLQKAMPEFSFRPIETTLRDMYHWMAAGS